MNVGEARSIVVWFRSAYSALEQFEQSYLNRVWVTGTYHKITGKNSGDNVDRMLNDFAETLTLESEKNQVYEVFDGIIGICLKRLQICRELFETLVTGNDADSLEWKISVKGLKEYDDLISFVAEFNREWNKLKKRFERLQVRVEGLVKEKVGRESDII